MRCPFVLWYYFNMRVLSLSMFILGSIAVLGQTVIPVERLDSLSDGTYRGVIGNSELPPASLLNSRGFVPMVQPSMSVNVPVPKFRGLDMARLSNGELVNYVDVRQRVMLLALNRLESIDLSLAIYARRLESAKSVVSLSADDLAFVEGLRLSLIQEKTFRKSEISTVQPDLDSAIAEERRRGLVMSTK